MIIEKQIYLYFILIINTLEFLTYTKYFNYYFSSKNQEIYYKNLFIYMIFLFIEGYFELPYSTALAFVASILFNNFTYNNMSIKNNIYHTIRFDIINYILFFILVILGILFFDTKQTMDNNFYQYLKGIIISALMYVGFSFFFDSTKKSHLKNIIKPYKRLINFLLLLIFFVLILFTFISSKSNINKKTLYFIITISIALNIGIVFLIIYIHQKLINLLQKTTENQLKLQEYKMNQSFYLELSEKINQLKILRHDFKNHLIIINGWLEQRKFDELDTYLNSIIKYVDSTEVSHEEKKSL